MGWREDFIHLLTTAIGFWFFPPFPVVLFPLFLMICMFWIYLLWRYLIVRNVPALGCGDELKQLFATYGEVEEYVLCYHILLNFVTFSSYNHLNCFTGWIFWKASFTTHPPYVGMSLLEVFSIVASIWSKPPRLLRLWEKD